MEASVKMMPANVGLVRQELDMEAYAGEEKERARRMLKNLNLDEKDHAAEVPKKKQRRTKKVMVRAGEAYIKYLKENPPPQPFEPLPFRCPLAREFRENHIAQQKADLEEHKRILKQYQDHGYADIEFVVYDDEEEV